MPSIITHGIVAAALAGKAKSIRVSRAVLLAVCAACAMLPDLDVVGFSLSIQYNSLFGHRGFTHSFFFAALVALGAGWILNRRAKGDFRHFVHLFLLLFAVTASHPLLDAMTDGGEGVALFSPFSNHRYFFWWRPIMVSPIGVGAFFGMRGLLVLLDELLLVIIPVAIVLYLPEVRNMARSRKLIALALAVAWAASLEILGGLYPLNNLSMSLGHNGRPVIDLFVKQYKAPDILLRIPAFGTPDQKLHTNFNDFQKLGLFNRRLATEDIDRHWASGFWANWYGGIAGRWQDSNATLMLRTLFGYGVPDSQEVLEVLKEAAADPAKRDFLYRLSPTEKYDLAMGDYAFTATKSVLQITHNASELPKYWYGICNGMAAAAKWYEEPYRTVDVINPNGFRIRFHPNDIKALLGFGLANVSLWTEIGTRCNINGPEAAGCRINPGAFFLATMNRIGLARDGFIVDGFSGTRKQFYLFDAARIEVLQPPMPIREMKEWSAPTAVRYLTEVRFTMEFVSTLLSDKVGGVPDETGKGDGLFYKKVGRVVVPRVLDAMLALDEKGEVIGGAWLGENDVPDVIFFPGPTPAVDDKDRLKASPAFTWPIINKIYYQSIDRAPDRSPIDLSL